ncbi:hypothetical protein [Bifidobacterium oedipodis]|uniref:Uncharacterized protein n=1 Tax=Bifidobacterium oedipodis TaxID=2675322 RepID=A0A7Y0EP66_9BIFI|nr:hypothetical protein [Bifidobacterium sp. DSM 109957]NMM93899.1 hypothetical protein [Bifidobacterium sp. DSM 109957]
MVNDPRCTWAKGRDGDWIIRIPRRMQESYEEAGESEYVVHKANGDTQVVGVTGYSKPFTGRDVVEYVFGYPRKEERRYPARRAGHRCDSCGRRGAHRAHDMSGLPCWLCMGCDDGSYSAF